MLTNEDITKIASIVATKEDVEGLKQDITGLRGSIQALTVSVDKLVKAVDDLKTKYMAITNQVNHHEKWFHQIAEKLGIKLEY